MKRFVYYSAVALHVLTGIGAFAGGMSAVLNPVSPMGMTFDALQFGPFTDFFIPGLFLLVVLGLGNIAAAVCVGRKFGFHAYVSGILGAILMGWIAIQCWILQSIVSLHVIFFCIGALQGLIALIMLYISRLFPLDLFRRFFVRD